MRARDLKARLRRLSADLTDAWGAVLASLLILLRPIVRIEVQRIWTSRIGHLTFEPEIWLCRRERRPRRRTITLFYARDQVCNPFLFGKWREILPLGPRWLLAPIFQAGERWPRLDVLPPDWEYAHGELRDLRSSGPHIRLTAEDMARGRALLQAMGLAEDQPFVCLAIRDGAYLTRLEATRDWSYHNYRDSRIGSYAQLAREFAEAGYAVLRMGALVSEPFDGGHRNIIDYANSPFRSDFGDVFLFSQCAACISTSTGMDAIARVFQRPLILANLAAGGCQVGGSLKLVMYKGLFADGSDAQLPLLDPRRLESQNYFRAADWQKAGLQLRDNTDTELRELAREVLAGLSTDWTLSRAPAAAEQEYVDRLFPDLPPGTAQFRLSPTWLASLPDVQHRG